jgi:hypothetical protein
MIAPHLLTIRNINIWNGREPEPHDLHYTDRILDAPHPDALEIDLGGYTLFPGLVNAHDHLELNHYPRTKFRDVYPNAHAWGEDVNARLNDEPYKSLRAFPLQDRCFIGGLKNLLCGALTVAHHGSPHKPLFRRDFPVRVLRAYGWAHSLHFNTDAEIIESYRQTPQDWPWFIHLAEGTDDVASGEYQRLKSLGCVGANTVIVHGVGMTESDIKHAAQHTRGLVWCPTTNHYLLGQTANVRVWGEQATPGSDSRLTADGDLLDEIRGGDVTLAWALSNGRRLLGLAETPFTPGQPADFWIPGDTLTRAHIQLIVRGGVPQIGDPDLMARFSHVETVPATLDGAPKAINMHLARRIARCTLKESGLELLETPPPRWKSFQRFF